MNALSTWLAMGGYAAFVWPAYGIAVIVLGGISLHYWRCYRVSNDELSRLQRQAGIRE